MKYVKNPTRIIEAIGKPAENCFGYFTQEKINKIKRKASCFGFFFCCCCLFVCIVAIKEFMQGGSFKGRRKKLLS